MGLRVSESDVQSWVRKGLVEPDVLPGRRPKGPWLKVVPDPSRLGRVKAERESLTVAVRIKTPNPLNLSGKAAMGWRIRTSKQHREAVTVAFFGHDLTRFATGCTVRLVRVSSGTLSDEGLRASLKRVRDAVAVLIFGGTMGQHDEHETTVWKYGQAKGGQGVYGVVITLEAT